MLSAPCLPSIEPPTITEKDLGWALWSLSDQEASLEQREHAAREWAPISRQVPSVFLTTCQRVELYIHPQWVPYCESHIDTSNTKFFMGNRVLEHLVQVTAGWKSIVEGESEIQGQVKRAYQQACNQSQLPASLHYLFQKSLQAGKYLRQNMEPARDSLAQRVLELLQTYCPEGGLIGWVGASALNMAIAQQLPRARWSSILFSRFSPSKGVLASFPLMTLEAAMHSPAVDALVVSSRAEALHIDRVHPRCKLIIDCSVPRRVDHIVANQAQFYALEELHADLREASRLNEPLKICCSLMIERYAEAWKAKQKKGSVRCSDF